MSSNFEVKTEKFAGPLEKLLEIIEEQKLDITQISLAEVTASFLKYIKKMEAQSVEPGVLADFLVVASRLVLIKSKILLPNLQLTEEEETDVRDLESRLKIYREFKAAAAKIDFLWKKKNIMHSRPLFMALGETSVFYPPKNISAQQLADTLFKLAALLKEFLPKTQTINQPIIKLEDKIKELMTRVQAAANESFKNMSKSKSKNEIVVLFLAILHLLRDKIVQVEQPEQFGDILFRKSHPQS